MSDCSPKQDCCWQWLTFWQLVQQSFSESKWVVSHQLMVIDLIGQLSHNAIGHLSVIKTWWLLLAVKTAIGVFQSIFRLLPHGCLILLITHIRDLWIQGQERLCVRDLTSSFLAYSQNIHCSKSFILPFFTRKVSAVTFREGGCTLYRSQNDKTSNIW